MPGGIDDDGSRRLAGRVVNLAAQELGFDARQVDGGHRKGLGGDAAIGAGQGCIDGRGGHRAGRQKAGGGGESKAAAREIHPILLQTMASTAKLRYGSPQLRKTMQFPFASRMRAQTPSASSRVCAGARTR